MPLPPPLSARVLGMSEDTAARGSHRWPAPTHGSLLAVGGGQACEARGPGWRDRVGLQARGGRVSMTEERPDAAAPSGNGGPPLMEVEHLKVHFPIKAGPVLGPARAP